MVVGVTAVSAAWHTMHDADSDCVVCEFENEPLAEVSAATGTLTTEHWDED